MVRLCFDSLAILYDPVILKGWLKWPRNFSFVKSYLFSS